MVAAMLLVAATAGAQVGQRFDTLSAPRPVPEFVLHDHDGRRFDRAALLGRWSLVSLGFTHCPDVCPAVLANLEAVRANLRLRLRADRIPVVIFVAVDPARDAPLLRNYISHFHPDYVGVTGDADQLRALVEGMGGFFRFKPRRSGDDSYEVQHSSLIYLIDPAGAVVATLAPPLRPDAAGDYLAGVIRRAPR